MEKGEDGAGGGRRAVLRCVCGHSISCEVQPAGEHIGFLAYLDDGPASQTYGERVKSCPGCGEQLGLPMLYRISRQGQ